MELEKTFIDLLAYRPPSIFLCFKHPSLKAVWPNDKGAGLVK